VRVETYVRVGLKELSATQRRVLAMIAEGRTNPEIAQALGISLDGAKWHVREILSKLNVDTREEAADAWREEHGLRRRLWQPVSGLLAMGQRLLAPAKTLIAAGTAMAIIAVVGVTILVFALTEDSTPPASSTRPSAVASSARRRRWP
jgi:DNA-binding CsgD family transcriptional regulator